MAYSSNGSERVPGAGDVAIMLAGEEYFLRPTAKAALTISRGQGGIRGAIDAVLKMEVDAVTNVVKLGLGLAVVRELTRTTPLEELVYESGLTDTSGGLVAKTIEFLHILANGGRPVGGDESDKKDGEDRPRVSQ
jgi:hypothetical protein